MDDAFFREMIGRMDKNAAARSFAAQFRRVYERFHRRLRPDAYQPTPETLAVLHHLEAAGPLTVTEAAAHFRRSQSAMSEILLRLERRELLVRYADERDRRRTLVWLSDRGLEVLLDAREFLSIPLLEAAFEQLPARKRGQVVAALEALLDTRPETKRKER